MIEMSRPEIYVIIELEVVQGGNVTPVLSILLSPDVVAVVGQVTFGQVTFGQVTFGVSVVVGSG